MNRSRRPPQNKQFVAGGVYNARQSYGSSQPIQSGQNYGNGTRQNQQSNSPSIAEQNSNQQPNVKEERKENAQLAPLEPPPQPPQMEDEPQSEDTGKVEEAPLYDDSGKLQYKNIFRTRKKSSVRAKEKKIRQNRQLRKTLIPKNALMALNEVIGITISEFIVNNSSGGGFTAVVTVNDKQYEGKGHSKIAAKNNASEKALRDYVLEKMREKPRLRKNSTNNDEAMETNETQDVSETVDENGEGGEAEQENAGTPAVIDDVPMVNLASFAIFKLFTEWENEGFFVPELRVAHPTQAGSGTETVSSDASPQVKTPKPPANRSELPTKWELIHPSTLLCMMRPGLQYRELGTVGDAPNILQRMGVTVDDVQYKSSGRSKKSARRNVAVCVLNELFGTNLTKEAPCED